jgi:hypothetical protein
VQCDIDEWSVRVFNRNRFDAAHHPYNSNDLDELVKKAQELIQRVMGFGAKPTRDGDS